MKKVLIVAGALFTLGAAPQAATAAPGGCIKYGIGGAIAGKLAGGHTWKGAAAGCLVGYLRRKQARNEISQREREILARHERQVDRDQGSRGYRDEGRSRYDDRRRGGFDPDGTGSLNRHSQSY